MITAGGDYEVFWAVVGTNGLGRIPYVFIGDDAFALSPNIMKPYPKHLWIHSNVFATTVS